jgi:hypothetical protein
LDQGLVIDFQEANPWSRLDASRRLSRPHVLVQNSQLLVMTWCDIQIRLFDGQGIPIVSSSNSVHAKLHAPQDHWQHFQPGLMRCGIEWWKFFKGTPSALPFDTQDFFLKRCVRV